MKGLIVLAHGSKVKETDETLSKILDEVKKNAPYDIVEGAYLQLMGPSLHEGVKSVYEKGCKEIVIFPFFLFAGNHIKEDIPAEIEDIKKEYTDLKITMLSNIGYDSKLVDIILDRVKGA